MESKNKIVNANLAVLIKPQWMNHILVEEVLSHWKCLAVSYKCFQLCIMINREVERG